MNFTCQTCQLFDPKTSTCHATPPVVPVNPADLAVFPVVTVSTWCGTHQPVRPGTGIPHNQPTK